MSGNPKLDLKLERGAAADLWRNTLSRIPTRFGRLVYLASLKDLNSGTYEHFGLAQVFGAKDADRTLRQSHTQAFAAWLNLNLEEQKADLEEYLAELQQDIPTILATWTRSGSYRKLIPARAREVEKHLYLSDFEIVLELLRHDHGDASPNPAT
jgi:hypothetical protein